MVTMVVVVTNQMSKSCFNTIPKTLECQSDSKGDKLPSVKTLELLIRILDIPGFLNKSRVKILTKKSTRSCKIVQRNSREKLTKVNENKQKTDANCNLISVPIMPLLSALPTKPSRSEIQYFVLSYIQCFKE